MGQSIDGMPHSSVLTRLCSPVATGVAEPAIACPGVPCPGSKFKMPSQRRAPSRGSRSLLEHGLVGPDPVESGTERVAVLLQPAIFSRLFFEPIDQRTQPLIPNRLHLA